MHPKKSLTQALNLAKQMESVMYNFPCKPYSPYKNPTPYNQHPTHVQSPNRQHPSSSYHPLLGLLPTLKPPFKPYSNPPKPFFPATTTKPAYSKFGNTSPQLTKGLKREEREERRKKGHCMWCGIKWVQGHSCIRSQLYHILVDDTDDHEEELEEYMDYIESMEEVGQKEGKEGVTPIISLHYQQKYPIFHP